MLQFCKFISKVLQPICKPTFLLTKDVKTAYCNEKIFSLNAIVTLLRYRTLSQTPRYPPLEESSLEEQFVRGSGPGGQATNTTSNCVVLKHVPTGIIVKCHAERSLERNRKIARKRLQMQLDQYYNGESSYVNVKKKLFAAKRERKKEKTRKKLEKLKLEKEQSTLNETSTVYDTSHSTTKAEENSDQQVALDKMTSTVPFDEDTDRFECIVLDLRKEKHTCANVDFESKLEASIAQWMLNEVRAVSIFVPKELSERIPVLVKHEFEFHHAKPGYVLMLRWLSKTDFNNFPDYASTYIGVAGFVVNNKNQVLAIRERYTGVEARWKLPGGGSDLGEDLHETAKREVFEETGVESEFQGVICFRQQHNFRYGCGDFYFVCLMKALTTELNPCTQEIAECKWMDLEEYEAQNLHPSNKYIYDSYLHCLKTGHFMQPTAVINSMYTGSHLMYRAEHMNNAQTNKSYL